MKAKPHDEAPVLAKALNQLFAAAPKDFVTMRDALARELKDGGEVEAAKHVKAVRKPDRVAWALNRIALADPQPFAAVFDAFDKASAEQRGGDAAKWKVSVAKYREALQALAHAVREALAEEDANVDAASLRRVTQTMQAATTDETLRDKILRGRVEKSGEDEQEDEGLEALGAPARAKPTKTASAPDKKAQRAAEAEEKRAKAEREAEEKRAKEEREAEEKRAREEARQHAIREGKRKKIRAKIAMHKAEIEELEAELAKLEEDE